MADVLIFDDDPSVGDLMSEVLRGKGLTVSHFLSGAGAVQLVQENKPRLVVLDIMMPGMDGLTACRTLKSNPLTRSVKIAVLTAKDFGEDRESALRYGADLFFNKPFDPTGFARSVSKILGFSDAPAVAAAPAPPVVVTILPGAAVLESAALWVIFDAGRGLREWLLKQPQLPKLAWVLLSRYQNPNVAEISALGRLLAAGGRVNLAGPDENEGYLQRCAPPMCATMPDGRRATPMLYPQREGEFGLAPGIRAETRFTQHPGTCLAYRVAVQGRAVVYCPAHEVAPDLASWNKHEWEKFRDLFEDADLLIHGYRRSLIEEAPKDAQGRGAWEPVVDLAGDAAVRHLALVPLTPQTSTEGVKFRAEERLAVKNPGASGTRCEVVRSDERVIL